MLFNFFELQFSSVKFEITYTLLGMDTTWLQLGEPQENLK